MPPPVSYTHLKAFKDYKNAVKYAGREYEIYEGIYENLTNKGETEEAKNYLKKALDIKPKDGADYAEQGHVYYLLEDYTQAKSSLDVYKRQSLCRLSSALYLHCF